MSALDTLFTRTLLNRVHADVKKHFPMVDLRTAIGVTGPSRKQYFVEIRFGDYPPLNEYFRAHDRYEAKAKAWMRYLERHAPGYATEAA